MADPELVPQKKANGELYAFQELEGLSLLFNMAGLVLAHFAPTQTSIILDKTGRPSKITLGPDNDVNGLVHKVNGGEFSVFDQGFAFAHPDIIEMLEDRLKARSLEKLFGVSATEWEAFKLKLQHLNYELQLRFIEGVPLVLFVDAQTGMPAPYDLNTSHITCLYFPDSVLEAFDIQPVDKQVFQKKLDDELLTLFPEIRMVEYCDDIFNDIQESLNDRLPDIDDPLLLTDFPFLEGEKREQFMAQVLDYLNPFLQPLGLKAIPAETIVPSSQAFGQVEGKFPLVDVLIVKDCETQGITIPGIKLLAEDAKKKPSRSGDLEAEEESPLIVYDQVGAFTLTEESAPLGKRKQLNRLASRQFKRYHPSFVDKNVITVTREVLEMWQEHGSPLPDEAAIEQTEQLPTRKTLDYGHIEIFQDTEPDVHIYGFEPGGKSHIGGTQLTVVVDYNGTKRAVMLDLGFVFPEMSYLRDLMYQAQYRDGLEPWLRLNQAQQTRRLYRLDLILNSLRPSVMETMASISRGKSETKAFNNNHEFIFMEAYHRLGEEGLINFLKENYPAITMKYGAGNELVRILEYARRREKVLYAQKTIFDGIFVSHAHQDHTGLIGLVRPELELYLTSVTRAMLAADHHMAASFLVADSFYIRDRDSGLKHHAGPGIRSYPVIERPHSTLTHGERLEIAPDIFLTGIDVYHSIPGAMGGILEVEHKGKLLASVGYPGDYRDGRFFEAVGERGGVDVLFIEGTNPHNDKLKKDSAKFSEADVKENFIRALAEANEREALIVTDIIKNNFERLDHLIDAAVRNGRTVVLSPKLVMRTEFLQMYHTTNGVPIPQMHLPMLKVWKRHMSTYGKEEERAFQSYGSVSDDEITANPQQYILIRDSNERPDTLNGIAAERTIWIQSKYGPYEHAARAYQNALTKYADDRGWEVRFSGYHASGHVTAYPSDHENAEEGVLAELDRAAANGRLADKMIFGHTQNRRIMAEIVDTYPHLQKIEKVRRSKHPVWKETLHTSEK